MCTTLRLLPLISFIVVAHFCSQATASILVGGGNNDNQDQEFAITTNSAPFLVSNPLGPVENRAAVEFDLRGLPTFGSFFDTRFIVRGNIESEKVLSIFGFEGDGIISDEDLINGSFVAEQVLTPSPGTSEIEFDITPFLNQVFPEQRPDFLGFNLRESESNGAVVTIEYLVTGTIDDTDFAQTQPASVIPEPSSSIVWALLLATCAGTYRRRGKLSLRG